MNIKYRQLKAFSLAARSLSFTQAADAMAVTQASFSNLIKGLEDNLGVVLFERSTRRCVLTEAGKVFQDNLQGSLDHLETLYRQMVETGQGKRGRLSVAALPSMSFGFIPAAVARYRAMFPDVEIVLRERRNDDVFRAVREREVELGLGSMLRPDPGLHWVPVITDRLLLILPEGHELAGQEVGWRALQAYPYIMMGTGPAEHAIRTHNLRIQTVFEVDHVATAVAMVRNGLGVTALPSSVLPALNMHGVTYARLAGKLAIRKLGVAHRKDSRLTRVAESFLELLRQAPQPT